jgi:23S rRNA (uracil1939-C5)-methyltransferase
VTVEKWVYGGEALSRVDGRVVLAPYLLPGEVASVDVVEERRGLLRAVPRDVTTFSPDRTDPPCPYFFRCGGCHYQHGSYDFQVRAKAEILREQLHRVGHLRFEGEIESVAGPPLGYRNRTQLHIDRGRLGYFGEGSHELVAIDQCPISSPRINETIGTLNEMMHDRRWPGFVRSIELFTNEEDVQVNVLETSQPVARRFFDWCAERIPGADKGAIEYAATGLTFQVSHNSFFQVNRFLVDRLAELAVTEAAGGSALDLYAGVGLFSIGLARKFERVTAVESGAGAARDLKINAERAGVALHVVQSNVEAYLPRMPETPDFVLADPPRSGLGKSVTAELVRRGPRQIVIVSCDPATLARDLAVLAAGGYRIARLVMIDLFPQTYHLETIATLHRD